MNHAGHMQETVGLLAGYGQFPVVFAQAARRLGFPVVCVGITEEAGPELKDLVDHFYWSRPAQLGKMINRFKKHGVIYKNQSFSRRNEFILTNGHQGF